MYTFARHVLTGHFIYLFIYLYSKKRKEKTSCCKFEIPPAFFVLFAFLFIMYSMGCWTGCQKVVAPLIKFLLSFSKNKNK